MVHNGFLQLFKTENGWESAIGYCQCSLCVDDVPLADNGFFSLKLGLPSFAGIAIGTVF